LSDDLLRAPVWIEPDLEALKAFEEWQRRLYLQAYAGMPILSNDQGSGSMFAAKMENISGRPLTFAKK
jgi:hypothetical protein